MAESNLSARGLPAWFWIVGSISSTVAIVQVNKLVFATWPYVTTLTLCHFIFQAIGFELCGQLGIFTIKRMPLSSMAQVSIAMGISIVSNNMSLDINSVGFYQGSKLLIIPTVMLLERIMDPSKTYSNKIKLAIGITIVGMTLATVSDPQTSPIGLLVCVIAVVSTGVAQIWIGTKQKEHKISPVNITHNIVGPMALLTMVPSIVFEGGLAAFDEECPLGSVLLSSFLGGVVNVFAYGIVGKLSPVTYQIVGNAKTILVIVLGILFFPMAGATANQVLGNLSCLGIAVSGMALYGHLKQTQSSGKPDVIDQCCPSLQEPSSVPQDCEDPISSGKPKFPLWAQTGGILAAAILLSLAMFGGLHQQFAHQDMVYTELQAMHEVLHNSKMISFPLTNASEPDPSDSLVPYAVLHEWYGRGNFKGLLPLLERITDSDQNIQVRSSHAAMGMLVCFSGFIQYPWV